MSDKEKNNSENKWSAPVSSYSDSMRINKMIEKGLLKIDNNPSLDNQEKNK
jgi:hypothetical protein